MTLAERLSKLDSSIRLDGLSPRETALAAIRATGFDPATAAPSNGLPVESQSTAYLTAFAEARLDEYNPDQPRDETGKWGAGGFGGGKAKETKSASAREPKAAGGSRQAAKDTVTRAREARAALAKDPENAELKKQVADLNRESKRLRAAARKEERSASPERPTKPERTSKKESVLKATDASTRAMRLSESAKTPEELASAAEAHREAAKLQRDLGSPTADIHEAKAREADAERKRAEVERTREAELSRTKVEPTKPEPEKTVEPAKPGGKMTRAEEKRRLTEIDDQSKILQKAVETDRAALNQADRKERGALYEKVRKNEEILRQLKEERKGLARGKEAGRIMHEVAEAEHEGDVENEQGDLARFGARGFKVEHRGYDKDPDADYDEDDPDRYEETATISYELPPNMNVREFGRLVDLDIEVQQADMGTPKDPKAFQTHWREAKRLMDSASYAARSGDAEKAVDFGEKAAALLVESRVAMGGSAPKEQLKSGASVDLHTSGFARGKIVSVDGDEVSVDLDRGYDYDKGRQVTERVKVPARYVARVR